MHEPEKKKQEEMGEFVVAGKNDDASRCFEEFWGVQALTITF